MKNYPLSLSTLLLLLATVHAADLEGTWRWSFAMPDGALANPILRLEVENGKVSGSSSFRAGSETPLTNVVFRNNELRFQVIRSRDGQDILTTYSGRLVGKSLVGKIESNWTGAPQTYDWRAEKVDGPNGVWRWTVDLGEREVAMQVTLKQTGAKLEGTYGGRGRGNRPTKIHKGVIDDDGQLSFEVEVGREGSRRVLLYKGKLSNDTITGAYETTVNGVVRESDWVARRAL